MLHIFYTDWPSSQQSIWHKDCPPTFTTVQMTQRFAHLPSQQSRWHKDCPPSFTTVQMTQRLPTYLHNSPDDTQIAHRATTTHQPQKCDLDPHLPCQCCDVIEGGTTPDYIIDVIDMKNTRSTSTSGWWIVDQCTWQICIFCKVGGESWPRQESFFYICGVEQVVPEWTWDVCVVCGSYFPCWWWWWWWGMLWNRLTDITITDDVTSTSNDASR